jgi:hypothetical protein
MEREPPHFALHYLLEFLVSLSLPPIRLRLSIEGIHIHGDGVKQFDLRFVLGGC